MKKNTFGTRLLSLLLMAAMLLGLVIVPNASVASAATGSSNSLLNLDDQPPAGLATAANPYGYGENVAFAMSVSNELLYFGGEDGDKHTHVFNGSNMDDLKKFVNAPNNGSGSYNVPDGTWNWVQAVAFDPSKDSSRDNHVLFVGVKESDQCAYAWVLNYDDEANTIVGPTKIGEMSWIGNTYPMYASTTLIEVAAGDFDGDGVDTLLAYVPLNLNADYSVGCSLFELKYTGSSLTVANATGNHLLMDTYINDQAAKEYLDQNDTGNDNRDKLAVSMQVADFNGDTVDDLAILSYSHNRSRGDSVAYYTPELNICYGGSSVTGLSKLTAQATYAVASKTSDGKHVFPMGACLAAGDYNSDGYDDLYVTGVKTTYSANSISEDQDNWYLQSWYGCDSRSLQEAGYTTTPSNEWFRGGFYTDDTCYSKVMSAGVAISGHAAAEMLFICGALYDVSTGSPVKVAQQGYFDSKDQGLNSVTCTNTYVQSVTVGNFDNNPADREQVVFVLGLKERGHDDYWFVSGMIGGSAFDDGTENGVTSYGPATEYYCTNMDDEASYIHKNKGDDFDEGLACLLIGLDYDRNDGIMAKYRGANYLYTDPQVRAVLQAAPYFGDISTAAGNATGYSLTTTYAKEDIDGHTTNFGLGFSVTGNGAIVHDATLDVGYKHTWNRTITETYSTEYSETFTAGAYDTVIVHRIPLIVYMYEIADENGKFKDNGTVNMEFSMPQEPVWQQMSIPAYNEFVDAYAAMMEGAKDLEGNPITFLGLNKIDEAENWLAGNEGNPYAYNDLGWANSSINAKQISTGTYALGTNGGSTEVTWNEGNSKNTEETHGCGFFVNASIHLGGKHWGVGAASNMDYTCNWGSASCTGSAVGTTCTVQDLDGPALLESGMDQATLDQYKFTWTFGQWGRDLGMRDEDGEVVYTPFLGYNVTGVSSPPRGATELSAKEIGADQIVLNWKEPTTPEGWPSVDGYVIYQIVTDDSGNQSAVKVAEVSAPASSYTVTSISDTALQPNTYYTFCVRSYHEASGGRVYGALSNEAGAVTALQQYQITTEYDAEKVDLVITKADGTPVSDGAMVEVGTELIVTATAKTEQYVLHRLAVYPTRLHGAKIENFSSSDGGKTITATCTVEQNTTFGVYAVEVFNEMKVSYVENIYDADTLAGTVTAKTDNVPAVGSGAWVSEPVTFTAAPEIGYKLTGWQLEVDGMVLVYPAKADSLHFAMPMVAEEVTVTAVFETILEKMTVTVNQPTEGGVIEVTDVNGNALTPQENGTYKVLYNTPVTFTVVPDVGYILSSWTGAAAEQASEQVTMNILTDTQIGAILRAPVKYSVYYTAMDENGNAVMTEPNITSGKPVAAGTPVTFTAQAADGYRISGWTVTRGGVTVDQYAKNQHVHSGSVTEIIQNETKVDVTFVPEDTYVVRVNQTGEGTVDVTCDGMPINSGDSVAYLSDVTITARAAENWWMTNVAGWINNGDGSYSMTLEDMEEDRNVDVVFESLYRTITVKQPAEGGVIVLRDATGKNVELDANGNCQLLMGTKLVAYIELDDSYTFGGWAEDVASLTGTRIELIVHGDMTIGAVINKLCSCRTYMDLSEDTWYHDACVYAIDNGIMSGTGTNTFSPNVGLSRAMVIQMIYNLEKRPDAEMTTVYTDVDAGAWYAKAVSWGTQNGIVSGVSPDKFAPDQLITREQMTTMLYRYTQYKEIAVEANADLSGFTDANQISGYAKEAMVWAVEMDLINGLTPTQLSPKGTATRAQAAMVFMQFMKNVLK